MADEGEAGHQAQPEIEGELSEQNTLMLQLLKAQTTGQLNCFKRDMLKEIKVPLKRDHSPEKIIPKFRKIGNERQFLFNSGVLAELKEVVHRTDGEISVKVGEIVKKIQKRNKVIRLSDSSEAGWAFAAEYENNDLADDEDDERRIRMISTI